MENSTQIQLKLPKFNPPCMTAEATTHSAETLSPAERARREAEVLHGFASQDLLREVAALVEAVGTAFSSGNYAVEEGRWYNHIGVPNTWGLNRYPNGRVEAILVGAVRGADVNLTFGKEDGGEETVILDRQFAHVETVENPLEGSAPEGISRTALLEVLKRWAGDELVGVPTEFTSAIQALLARDTDRLAQEVDTRVAVARNEQLGVKVRGWRGAFFAAVAALFVGAGVHFQKPLEEGLEEAGDRIEEVGKDAGDVAEEVGECPDESWKRCVKDVRKALGLKEEKKKKTKKK